MKKLLPFFPFMLAVFMFLVVIANPSCSKQQCQTTENTELLVVNNTSDTVVTWLTLSVYTDTLKNYFVQNVFGIFGIADSGATGTFTLLPNDTLSYTSTLALSGNLCFGGPPLNCSSAQFPYATNIFEFCLNNDFGTAPQESVEISCVAGVNSYLIGRLVGNYWTVTQGIDTVRTFKNDLFGHNTGLYGVFPTGCTNCTNQAGAPVCSPALPFDKPNDKPICIIQRPAIGSGGQVYCIFDGFTPNICK
jgi:hypothetical protein